MKYGLIGEKLGHSFSKQIHESLNDYKYELVDKSDGEEAGIKSATLNNIWKEINKER